VTACGGLSSSLAVATLRMDMARQCCSNISPRLGFNRSVPPAAEVFEAAEKRWHT